MVTVPTAPSKKENVKMGVGSGVVATFERWSGMLVIVLCCRVALCGSEGASEGGRE